jgi:hypothetical protein
MKPVVYTRPMPGSTNLSIPKIQKSLREDAENISIEMMLDFLPTVRTWSQKAEFKHSVEVKSSINFVMTAGTDNDIYSMLNEGTRAHFVGPRNVSALRFRGTYTAKTIPGVLSSKGGGASGEYGFSKGHWVSGIKPRDWDLVEAKNLEKKLPARVEKAIKRALDESVVSQGA